MNDITAGFNETQKSNFAGDIGLIVERATKERMVGTLEIQPRHLQPFGIVHGGVYCTIVESLASLGAFLNVADEGKVVAGIENHTSFLRSTSAAKVTGGAFPVNMGRPPHLGDGEGRDAGSAWSQGAG